MNLGRIFRSLIPGDDHALAARDYPGCISASESAAQKRRGRHRRQISEAVKDADAWERRDRKRFKA